ncbi:SDR family oxidoreductase [Rhodopila sp.]|uniref:SDR family oxidoreductase n=1 Tax=Rhodopila sp. TaxID=2480087 RepID=UPI003D0B2023
MAQSESFTPALTAAGDRTRKTVVITGAGSGIGLAAALRFAQHGWQIGLIGRGEAALRDAKSEVEMAGGIGHVAMADVSDSAALELAATEIETAFGPIDVWINNAGIGFYGKFTDVPEEAFRRVIDVNVMGTVNGTRIALSRMKPRNRGTIVQILSAVSYRGIALQSAYSTSKYGLRGFTEAVRSELINERSAVQITMVHPPAVNTPFYSHAGSVMDKAPRPPPPVYQPELLGEAIYLAATSRRREWRVTGSTVGFAVGNTIAPDLLDHLVGLVGVAAQKTTRAAVVSARDPNTFTASTKPSGTHGPFDRESLASSIQWTISKSPAAMRFGFGLLAMGVFYAARGRR